MTEDEMKRSIFDKTQYAYLSKQHSALYDDAIAARDIGGDEWAAVAVSLLLRLAEASRHSHVMTGR